MTEYKYTLNSCQNTNPLQDNAKDNDFWSGTNILVAKEYKEKQQSWVKGWVEKNFFHDLVEITEKQRESISNIQQNPVVSHEFKINKNMCFVYAETALKLYFEQSGYFVLTKINPVGIGQLQGQNSIVVELSI